MNNTVACWNFESGTNQKKPMGLDHDLVELLWQNGQVVLNCQTHRKPVANSMDSTQVQKNFQSTFRTSEPFGNSRNLIDETISWIQYPIEDPLEQEFCSDLLSELPPFEEVKFSKLDASSSPHVMVSSQSPNVKPSCVQEFLPMPAPRFNFCDDSSQKNNDLGGAQKVLNFPHFSAPPNVSSEPANEHFRGKVVGNNLSKSDVRECSVMTAGSSYCGSNQIPQQDLDVSRASSNGVWATALSADPGAVRDYVQRTIPQNQKGKSEMLEPAVTSSSGGSGSIGKTCSLSTRNHSQKRKSIDAEESEEQSEDTELKSAVGNKPSHRAGSSRKNRAAEVHNLSERRRRDRINEKMKALQQLIPHSSKTDKASMLEEAIEYLKSLQLQLQVMWMGSGMAPVMFPGIQHYMSQISMGMAAPSFPPIHNPMQLPRVPLDQSISVSQTPNQTLMCQNPLLSAFNYQNQMQNPVLMEQCARYMGYHHMQSAPQAMNVFGYGSQAVQHNQTMIPPPSNSSGPMSGASNIDGAVSGKMC